MIGPKHSSGSISLPYRVFLIALVSSLTMLILITIQPRVAQALPIVTEFTTTLQPGIWHGFSLGAASTNRGYLAEVSPLQPSTHGGAHIERYVVQPEFNGVQWNDVLRVQIPSGDPALKVHIRVYESANLPVVSAFTTTLQPGIWHRFSLGAASTNRGYLAEVSPLQPSTNGAHIERYVVQPEFNGVQWNDVLRVQIPSGDPALKVHIRVYESANLPVVSAFTTTLQPGIWHGFSLGAASTNRGYLAEVSPLQPSTNGAHIERYVVQPEFDGAQWNDVLRVQIPSSEPALEVHIRVYSVEDTVGGLVTGVKPRQVICTNVTTGQTVIIRDRLRSWNCEAAGIIVNRGETIRQTIIGIAN